MEAEILELMSDVFGNYVVQKLMDFGAQHIKQTILDKVRDISRIIDVVSIDSQCELIRDIVSIDCQCKLIIYIVSIDNHCDLMIYIVSV